LKLNDLTIQGQYNLRHDNTIKDTQKAIQSEKYSELQLNDENEETE
jgi:hypothetical protein